MSTVHTPAASTAGGNPADACQGSACTASAPQGVVVPAGWARFRVPTMDCASEESEIRRAVEHLADIRAMTFQLGQRTMAIDAPPACVEQAVAAISKAGFDPQPVPETGVVAASEAGTGSDDHDHGAESGGAWRLGGALLLALGAEVFGFFAPDTQVWKAAGLALAAAAIWLAGFDVYKKGLTALRHGRLNINALMAGGVLHDTAPAWSRTTSRRPTAATASRLVQCTVVATSPTSITPVRW